MGQFAPHCQVKLLPTTYLYTYYHWYRMFYALKNVKNGLLNKLIIVKIRLYVRFSGYNCFATTINFKT